MIFSSLTFVGTFLPVTVGVYYLADQRYKNYILLVASILFYSFGEPLCVFLLLASILINYVVAIAIDQNCYRKSWLIIGITANLLVLFWFKYSAFVVGVLSDITGMQIMSGNGVKLPIGISFYTFQGISYLIDVYRKEVKPQKNICSLALYISFFPQLIAGPIVRYKSIEGMIAYRNEGRELFAEGVRRFFIGFCKKILIANNLSGLTSEVFDRSVNNLGDMSCISLWLGSIAFTLQIYYDFSGYSDMAIGLGRMFGFIYDENFDYPYAANSVTDFWRRWHISLSSWFRDYLYIPLGGSRVKFFRHIFNIFVVWLLTGIWHGAGYNYIAWGLYYFFLLVIEKYTIKPWDRKIVMKMAWKIMTLICVNFGWVIFNSVTLKDGIQFCKGMLGMYDGMSLIDARTLYYLREYGLCLFVGILLSFPIWRFVAKSPRLEAVVLGMSYLFALSFLIMGTNNPFLYFNF